MLFYNIGIFAFETGIRFSSLWNNKGKLWSDGRKSIISKITSTIRKDDRIFWVHAASVGEFEQGRPIIEYVRKHHPEYKILITFYSPSGFELRKNYKGADYIFYFPSDRKSQVKMFLDAIHPEIAVFIKYEFWLNTLKELKSRNVRTYLVSSIFNPKSVFFKPWGKMWRDCLSTFDTIFVQNQESKELLSSIDVFNAVVAGDTRFDRVSNIVSTAEDIPLVERFAAGSSRIFVAGSTWGPDEDLLIRLVNDHPDIKFIIAPHEMEEERIQRIIKAVNRGATRFTNPDDDIENKQVLIIDTIGLLSAVYKYASWVYVGGGFGVGIHNTVEPASYGLPIAFGPKYGKFDEAVSMVRLGVAHPVTNYQELASWFLSLKEDEGHRTDVCQAARAYTQSQLGATDKIINIIGL